MKLITRSALLADSTAAKPIESQKEIDSRKAVKVYLDKQRPGTVQGVYRGIKGIFSITSVNVEFYNQTFKKVVTVTDEWLNR